MTTSAKSKKSDTYKIGLHLLFAELLHKEIDDSIRQLLLQPDILEVFCEIEPACKDYLTQDWTDEKTEQAAVDFCDLFILPETATAPRAAAWLKEGDPITAEIIDTIVTRYMTEWKIEVPPSYQQLARDHASLIFYLSATIRQESPEQADAFDEAAIFSWIPAFGKAIAKTENPVYRSLGVLLEEISHA